MPSPPNHLPLPAAVLDAGLRDREHLRHLLLAHPSVDLKAELSALEEVREIIESIFLRLLFCDLGDDPAQIFALARQQTADPGRDSHDQRGKMGCPCV